MGVPSEVFCDHRAARMWAERAQAHIEYQKAEAEDRLNRGAIFQPNSYTPNPYRKTQDPEQCQGCGAWGHTSCDYCGNPIERAG